MAKRNLTVQLDEEIIERANVTATRRGTSISELVSLDLERLVEADERYEEAERRAERAMGRTQSRGSGRWARDELYER